jgi:hypothetical protein
MLELWWLIHFAPTNFAMLEVMFGTGKIVHILWDLCQIPTLQKGLYQV